MADERRTKNDMSKELERIILPEEVTWRQKSRALWLREGDKSTNFFSPWWLVLIKDIIPCIL
jgi:hypothetical protein